jgi:hypothetical protein
MIEIQIIFLEMQDRIMMYRIGPNRDSGFLVSHASQVGFLAIGLEAAWQTSRRPKSWFVQSWGLESDEYSC